MAETIEFLILFDFPDNDDQPIHHLRVQRDQDIATVKRRICKHFNLDDATQNLCHPSYLEPLGLHRKINEV